MLLPIVHCRLSSSAKYYSSRHRCQRHCRLDRRSAAQHPRCGWRSQRPQYWRRVGDRCGVTSRRRHVSESLLTSNASAVDSIVSNFSYEWSPTDTRQIQESSATYNWWSSRQETMSRGSLSPSTLITESWLKVWESYTSMLDSLWMRPNTTNTLLSISVTPLTPKHNLMPFFWNRALASRTSCKDCISFTGEFFYIILYENYKQSFSSLLVSGGLFLFGSFRDIHGLTNSTQEHSESTNHRIRLISKIQWGLACPKTPLW